MFLPFFVFVFKSGENFFYSFNHVVHKKKKKLDRLRLKKYQKNFPWNKHGLIINTV